MTKETHYFEAVIFEGKEGENEERRREKVTETEVGIEGERQEKAWWKNSSKTVFEKYLESSY